MSDNNTSDNTTTQENDAVGVVVIPYIDKANYYMVYGVTTLIILLLILYYFTRSQMFDDQISRRRIFKDRRRPVYNLVEGMKSPAYTDQNYRYGPLPKGKYGDVDVYFYETSDLQHTPEWRKVHGGLYIHNSKTWWKDTNRPVEADFWESQKEPFHAHTSLKKQQERDDR